MSLLQKIKRGGETLPPRIILSGPEGIGKSTWASQSPEPIFISQEDGLCGLDHVARIQPQNFNEILALCAELAVGEHPYKTLVIDTADWLERSIHQFICKRDGKNGVEDYGYGKGYKVAEAELMLLLNALDILRHKKSMGIIILSHVHIRPFTDPAGEAWDRYEMKGHKGFTGILREWPEACLFATYEVFKTKDKGENRERAIAGERVIHTEWSPAWDAKNRMSLPPVLPLDYAKFSEAIEANSPARLREQYVTLLATANMPEKDREKWQKVDVLAMDPNRIRNGIAKLQAMQKAA